MAVGKTRALMPCGKGHQFVFYGDSCSGVPGALHAEKLAKVNTVVRSFDPPPEFIVFPGDEVIGLVPDEAELRRQWHHFMDVEMAWLDRSATPIYHATGNHTTYDRMSERVFAEMMAHLPRNGPAGQEGLSYFIRRGDLLLVFIHTCWSGLGGEGHVELEWLSQTLGGNRDARWKFVIGHHPAFPINGYVGTYQRTVGDEYVPRFWRILRENGVTAYLTSHILAFDVQCRDGVLQITSAGAGTAHRMPEGIEYLHCVQMVVDQDGLRYQVVDEEGEVRERLSWPPRTPDEFRTLQPGHNSCGWHGTTGSSQQLHVRIQGTLKPGPPKQTILAALDDEGTCPLWIGLVGVQRQLIAVMQPQPGRSPHQWQGPSFADHDHVDLDLLIHGEMGPGGFLWRTRGEDMWTGFSGLSAWGPERLVWPENIYVGRHGDADQDTLFAGRLSVSASLGRQSN